MYDNSNEVANLLKKDGVKGTTKLGVFVNYDGMEKANTYVEKSTGKVYSQQEFVDFLKQKFPGLKE